jgi:hypothetical protein
MRTPRFLPVVVGIVGAAFLATAALAAAGQHPAMPPGMTHEEHLAQMQKDAALKQRGALAMGFDQDAAAHHFVLTPDGGNIEIAARKAGDDATRSAIRTHLADISRAFAEGVFDKPTATHAEAPPGVETMRRLRASIRYAYEDAPSGGRVRIITANSEARRAVHEFLRYQIVEHATGDPQAVQR